MKPVGKIGNFEVFLREHVCEAHTREKWLEEARQVHIGEQPAKAVKKRKHSTPEKRRQEKEPPKKRRKKSDGTAEVQDENEAEEIVTVYGKWQTEPYQPPEVKDGIVPKNSFGNCYLFRPEMLPVGAVHLPEISISLARKLGIDAVPAMVGWDYSRSNAHPQLEGIVVASEYAETLISAQEEQEAIKIQVTFSFHIHSLFLPGYNRYAYGKNNNKLEETCA